MTVAAARRGARLLLASVGMIAMIAMIAMTGAVNAADDLAGPEQFASIGDQRQRALALFEEMGKVLQHPRCVNCHPKGERPLQGDAMEPHQPPVVRGAGGFGAAGMRCQTCHASENVTYQVSGGSVPGHVVWHLAPASMAWEDRSLGEICEQIKDPSRNGGKSLDELHQHNAEDGLVGWGWEPGDGREPAPGSQQRFGELTRAWIDAGAHCPSS